MHLANVAEAAGRRVVNSEVTASAPALTAQGLTVTVDMFCYEGFQADSVVNRTHTKIGTLVDETVLAATPEPKPTHLRRPDLHACPRAT
jgi:hypothetical protein